MKAVAEIGLVAGISIIPIAPVQQSNTAYVKTLKRADSIVMTSQHQTKITDTNQPPQGGGAYPVRNKILTLTKDNPQIIASHTTPTTKQDSTTSTPTQTTASNNPKKTSSNNTNIVAVIVKAQQEIKVLENDLKSIDANLPKAQNSLNQIPETENHVISDVKLIGAMVSGIVVLGYGILVFFISRLRKENKRLREALKE
ncbi:MAG: hypothetical protein M1569_00545 [Candidatus Marsarchaeota archaeon]|nr:hypothetical protein [Candidatus Marsarchaeota archaeon]MCL5412878.1 hypothetical protein [Candidatus Marsarchaeota archaeon]